MTCTAAAWQLTACSHAGIVAAATSSVYSMAVMKGSVLLRDSSELQTKARQRHFRTGDAAQAHAAHMA